MLYTIKFLDGRPLKSKGVRKRVEGMAKEIGMRPKLKAGQKRHEVKLDHGFRKFFNTMCRRAKVEYADKEAMMGHKVGLEKSYERYKEQDFELFGEYKKVIPFLTIDPGERAAYEMQQKDAKILELEEKSKRIEELEKIVHDIQMEKSIKPSVETEEKIMKILKDKKII